MNYKTFIYVILILSISGCSQKPIDFPILKSAEADYNNLKKDDRVVFSAPMALFEAGKIYQMTKAVKTKDEANHLAYMLKNQIKVAKEIAATKELEEKIVSLKESRVQALLQDKDNQILKIKKEAEKARLEAQASRLDAQVSKEKFLALQELNAKQTNRGLVLTLEDVLFETGRSNLLSGSMRVIEKLSDFLSHNPKRLVLIEGHTDNVGSRISNLDLSLRRSGSVAEALSSKGIAADRLFVKGYADAFPVASNDDLAGQQRNRRVVIVILEEGVEPSSMTRNNL